MSKRVFHRKKRIAKRPHRRGKHLALMYKSPRMIMPQEYTTDFTYVVQNVLVNAGATQYAHVYSTELYDVDTTFGSSACAGFVELSSIYSRFRPLRMSYDFNFSNLDAFPYTLIAGFGNSQISTGSLGINYAGNPFYKITTIGDRIGNGIKRLKGSASVVQVAGTKQPLYDDIYTGSTQSATLNTKMWLHCGAIGSAPMVNGVLVTARIVLRVTLYKPFFMNS